MKNKYYKLVWMSAIFIAAQTVSLKAQTPKPCGTEEVMRKMYAEHPELIQQQIDFDNAMKQVINAKRQSRSVSALHIIPVVFHVIYSDPTGTDNIPDAQIYDEMKILNRDYAKLNADTSYIIKNSPFDTLASNVRFEFRLATIDPNGNCTNGIERIQSHLGIQATDAAKLNQWPRDKYLNIWTVQSIGAPGSTAAAYALYPSAVVNYPQGDGVLSMSGYVGSIGPGTSLGTSRTITHEIGHCMNLEHVWGNNNNADVACGDDGVDDTPITKGHLYDCTPTPHCTRSNAKHIVYNFNGLQLPQGANDPTVTTDTSAILGHFTSNNVSSNSVEASRFSYINWPVGAPNGDTSFTALTGSIDPTKYYEVTVSPNTYNYMLISGLNFNVGRSASGIRTFAVRSSADGFSSNLPASISPANSSLSVRTGNIFFYKKDTTLNQSGCHISLTGGAYNLVGSGQSMTFRFYGWNAENIAGTFSLDDVTLYTTNNRGHDTITYNFNGVNPPSALGTLDPTTLQVDTAVTVGQFHARGVSANPIESNNFSFSKWNTGGINGDNLYTDMTGAIDTTKYYEVSLGANYGNLLTLTGLSFDVKRNGTGVRSYAVRSSVNNFASNLTPNITPANTNLNIQNTSEFFFANDTNLAQTGSHIALSGASYTNFYKPIKFRFYGWNAEDSLGSFTIDNVSFTDTAGLIENFDNYMDYSYCSPWGQRMFTKGQKDRMRAALESGVSSRDHLFLNSNLVATGTQSPYPPVATCPPKPDFFSNRKSICVGGTVTFYRNIMNVTHRPGVSSFKKVWYFDGGTPASVTLNDTLVNYNAAASGLIAQNVTYSAPGDYAVKLVVTNSAGSDSIIKTSYIHVDAGWAQYGVNQPETFESAASYYWNWNIDNYDNNPHTWGLINFAGYSGTHSMVMNGFDNYFLDLDDFITPGYNLSYLTGGALTFQCAAASSALTSADINDVLKIYASKDCGQSWLSLGTPIQGAALCNNGYSGTSFVPNSQSQWAFHSINIPTLYCTGNVKFKFAYTSGNASNNVFIDDINVTGVLGINENSLDNTSFSLYPNPSKEATNIFYHLNTKGNVKIEVLDVLGKKVMELDNKNQVEGDYTYSISKQEHNMNNGIYFVRFSFDNNSVTKKLIFTE